MRTTLRERVEKERDPFFASLGNKFREHYILAPLATAFTILTYHAEYQAPVQTIPTTPPPIVQPVLPLDSIPEPEEVLEEETPEEVAPTPIVQGRLPITIGSGIEGPEWCKAPRPYVLKALEVFEDLPDVEKIGYLASIVTTLEGYFGEQGLEFSIPGQASRSPFDNVSRMVRGEVEVRGSTSAREESEGIDYVVQLVGRGLIARYTQGFLGAGVEAVGPRYMLVSIGSRNADSPLERRCVAPISDN